MAAMISLLTSWYWVLPALPGEPDRCAERHRHPDRSRHDRLLAAAPGRTPGCRRARPAPRKARPASRRPPGPAGGASFGSPRPFRKDQDGTAGAEESRSASRSAAESAPVRSTGCALRASNERPEARDVGTAPSWPCSRGRAASRRRSAPDRGGSGGSPPRGGGPAAAPGPTRRPRDGTRTRPIAADAQLQDRVEHARSTSLPHLLDHFLHRHLAGLDVRRVGAPRQRRDPPGSDPRHPAPVMAGLDRLPALSAPRPPRARRIAGGRAPPGEASR